MSLIAEGLAIASDDELFTIAFLRDEQTGQIRRRTRISLLQQLLFEYRREIESGQAIKSQEGEFKSVEHYWLHATNNVDLLELLKQLDSLLDTETSCLERYEPETLPNSRPPSAKNTGAKCIHEILVELGVDTWRACHIIADMLLAGGIDDRPRQKVQRSLYDKLARTSIR